MQLLERAWDLLADLCVPVWAAGLNSMPPHDRVASVEMHLARARLTGFPKPDRCEPHPSVAPGRHLRLVRDDESDYTGPRSLPG